MAPDKSDRSDMPDMSDMSDTSTKYERLEAEQDMLQVKGDQTRRKNRRLRIVNQTSGILV
jgi:hypothetical protein